MEISRMESDTQTDHIWPHRAWLSVTGAGEFSPHEQRHIQGCVHCLQLFLLCLESDNFGAVLQELEDGGPLEGHSAQQAV